jgi:hypothetical protein
VPEEFWLHVHDDGREERYDHDPAPIRALRVVIIDGFEETWTADRVSRPGWECRIHRSAKAGWRRVAPEVARYGGASARDFNLAWASVLETPTCGGAFGDGHRAINDRPAVFSAK